MLKEICSIIMILFLFKAAKADVINSETLLNRAKSIVLVESASPEDNTTIRGTGFFVSKDLVVTNYHVIKNSFVGFDFNKYIKITNYDSTQFITTKLEFVDAFNDMAILKVKSVHSKYYIDIDTNRKESPMIKGGEDSFVIGFPAFKAMEVNKGHFIYTNNILNENEITLSGRNLQPGISGSPVFDKMGLLVGLFNSITPIGSDLRSCPKKGYIGYLTNSDLLYKNLQLYKANKHFPSVPAIVKDFNIDRVKSFIKK